MKSSTVRQSLSVVRRSPRPSCCRKTSRALRRPEEEQRVDLGEIDALVEQVHREERPHLVRPAASPARAARRRCRCRRTPPADGRPASVNRRAMNSACAMLTQNPSARIVPASRCLSLHLLQHQPHPRIVAGVEVLELADVVARRATTGPTTGRCCRAARSTGTGRAARAPARPRAAVPRRCDRRSSGGCPRRRCVPASR